MLTRAGTALLLAAGLTAGGAARAADPAGAAELETALNGFFADLAATLLLDIEPAAPVTVAPAADGYLATVAPLSIAAAGDPPGEGGGVVAVAGFDIRLWPQDDNRDRTAFAVQSWPAATLTVDGAVVAELTASLVSDEGVWSHALGLPVSETSVIEDLHLRVGSSDPQDGGMLVVAASRFELSSAITGRDGTGLAGESWDVRSKATGTDVGIYVAGPGVEMGIGPADPETGLSALYHYATVSSDSLLTDVPLAAWGAYLDRWLVPIAERASGIVLSPEDGRALLATLLDEAPRLPDRVRLTTSATDLTAAGITMARQSQSFEVTGLAGDVLTMRQTDSAEGLAFTPSLPMPLMDQLGALVPESYRSELVLHDLPLGHAWRELAGTVDAWVDDPDAAAEVFFRSFADRALAIGSAAELDLRLTWPASQFVLDLDLAVSETAERVVIGTIDGAFENMAAFSDLVETVLGPEAASGVVVFEAFGQREAPEGDGPVVTRYLVEIGEDGHVTFNGQSYDAVLRMIDDALENGLRDLSDMIPDQD